MNGQVKTAVLDLLHLLVGLEFIMRAHQLEFHTAHFTSASKKQKHIPMMRNRKWYLLVTRVYQAPAEVTHGELFGAGAGFELFYSQNCPYNFC